MKHCVLKANTLLKLDREIRPHYLFGYMYIPLYGNMDGFLSAN